MVEKKKSTSEAGKPQTGTPPTGGAAPAGAASPPAGASAPAATGRKPWVKKTPVEVVLEQIGKQEKKVEDLKAELKKEEGELRKLQQAKKVLEATE